jgi:hypothetical protein
MLVKDGGQGIQTLAKLGEAFLELDGFGFVHFRGESGFSLGIYAIGGPQIVAKSLLVSFIGIVLAQNSELIERIQTGSPLDKGFLASLVLKPLKNIRDRLDFLDVLAVLLVNGDVLVAVAGPQCRGPFINEVVKTAFG